jgi:hypothetical protein
MAELTLAPDLHANLRVASSHGSHHCRPERRTRNSHRRGLLCPVYCVLRLIVESIADLVEACSEVRVHATVQSSWTAGEPGA